MLHPLRKEIYITFLLENNREPWGSIRDREFHDHLASIPAVTKLRKYAHIFVRNIFFLVACSINSSPEVTF
jgi:hypothetical protein